MVSLTDQSIRWKRSVKGRDTCTGTMRDGVVGQYYYQHRTYAAQLGRFVSRDPLGSIDGPSLYQGYFVGAAVDPSGQCAVPTEYCGPDATDLLVEELQFATETWSRQIRYWTGGFFRFRWYLGVGRWNHMLAIGPQLDWTNLSSGFFTDNDRNVFCPTKKCKNTYRICGTCVHDHFIGNIMFGYWCRLHRIYDPVANGAGHMAQIIGDTESRGWDKPWDQAGYQLGRILSEGNFRLGMPMTRSSVCALLKGNSVGAGYFDLANQTGNSLSHCVACPKGLDGGIRRWAKRFNGGYTPF